MCSFSPWGCPCRSNQLTSLKPDDIHHQRVSVPAADGIAQISRIRIFRVLPPVHPDNAPHVLRFVDDDDAIAHLQDVDRMRRKHHPRNPWGKAVALRIVLRQVIVPLIEYFLSQGRKRDIGGLGDAGSGFDISVTYRISQNPLPLKSGLPEFSPRLESTASRGAGSGGAPLALLSAPILRKRNAGDRRHKHQRHTASVRLGKQHGFLSSR